MRERGMGRPRPMLMLTPDALLGRGDRGAAPRIIRSGFLRPGSAWSVFYYFLFLEFVHSPFLRSLFCGRGGASPRVVGAPLVPPPPPSTMLDVIHIQRLE